MSVPIIRVESLSKTFPGQRAVDRVTFEIRGGEIYGLVGQNGSGKSTIIKTLSGFHRPDPGGRVLFLGEEIDLRDPRAPGRHRMHFIHQDLALVPSLDTVDNVGLVRGYDTGIGRRIRWRSERARVRSLLRDFDMEFDVSIAISELAPGERTMVAIVRALGGWDGEPGLLVLDEPTVALPEPEVKRVFSAVRRVAESGIGVLFVSHRLDEVLDLCDRVGVLRDGGLVAERSADEISHDELVELIAGRPPADLYVDPPTPRPDVVLRARGLEGRSVSTLSFDVHAGEILGFTGLLGSGREEVADLVFGSSGDMRGSVAVDGAEISRRAPWSSMRAGIGMVPSDRLRRSAIPALSARENISLPSMRSIWRRFRLNRSLERNDVIQWMGRVGVIPLDPERPLRQFSGGNQQKCVLAKWLRVHPKILVLDEPTQGVDVGAKASILQLLARTAAEGVAVVVVSADTDDLAQICDRVIVLRGGRAAAELGGARLTAHNLLTETMRGGAGVSN